jgi:hypothetical protein
MTFEDFWKSWPSSTRKGGKSTCKAKWDKLKLDAQADQIIKHVIWMKTTDAWKKQNGEFIPAPLVYINQMRWDGAEVPDTIVNVGEMTVNMHFVDPAIEKVNRDLQNAVPMPENIKARLEELRKTMQVH